MPQRPTIQTSRLTLRPFDQADADQVASLAGERPIAEMTLRIPHPYTRDDARAWLSGHQAAFDAQMAVQWAIVVRATHVLVGAVGLELGEANVQNARAELGYWIGVPFWNNGYATEAGIAAVRYGFESLPLQRIFASHFVHNPASGRIIRKIGMKHEGRLRSYYLKWGKPVDIEMYAILRGEPVGSSNAS